MTGARPRPADELEIVAADESRWSDLQTVFGARGTPAACQCQRVVLPGNEWWYLPKEGRRAVMREELREASVRGLPPGLIGYLDGEPVAWVRVGPRADYLGYQGRSPTPWAGRNEDKQATDVWAVVCFVTRAGFRKQGFTRAMLDAAVEFARERGAVAVEGYPMLTVPGQEITWDELKVGARSVFADAGFTEVTHPSKRRFVMRLELGQHAEPG